MFSLSYSINTNHLKNVSFFFSFKSFIRDAIYPLEIQLTLFWPAQLNCAICAKKKTGVKPSFIIWRKQIKVPDYSLQSVSWILSHCQALAYFQSLNRVYGPARW